MISLRSALTPLNLTSLRALETFTGVSDPSARKQISRALIFLHYPRVGGPTGAVGAPMGDVKEVDGGFLRPHTGGFIQLLDTDVGPEGFHTFQARVRFVGFRCNEQSEGGPDEPYFIVGVQGMNQAATLVKTIGPFEGSEEVKTGDNRFLEEELTATAQPPFVIHVAAMDHDSGSPAEASGEVEKGMKKGAALLTATLTPLAPQIVLTVGGAVQSFLAILGGPLSDGISALLGMGDDLIGQNSFTLFDYDTEKDEWRNPKPLTSPHFDRPFNVELALDNGEGGSYTAFFQVALFKIDAVLVPTQE